MKIKPLGGRVLVRRMDDEAQTSEGGIIIPDTAKEKPTRGEIVAIGEGSRNDAGERIPFDVKVGDTVIFSKYGGTEVKIEGEEYQIMSESDILGIVE